MIIWVPNSKIACDENSNPSKETRGPFLLSPQLWDISQFSKPCNTLVSYMGTEICTQPPDLLVHKAYPETLSPTLPPHTLSPSPGPSLSSLLRLEMNLQGSFESHRLRMAGPLSLETPKWLHEAESTLPSPTAFPIAGWTLRKWNANFWLTRWILFATTANFYLNEYNNILLKIWKNNCPFVRHITLGTSGISSDSCTIRIYDQLLCEWPLKGHSNITNHDGILIFFFLSSVLFHWQWREGRKGKDHISDKREKTIY